MATVLRAASSRKNFLHHVPVNIGEAEIAAGILVRQLLVVETQQGEDGGVPVMDVDLVYDGLVAVVVSLSVAHAALHAATGHPEGEALVVVIAAIAGLGVRGAAEF